MFSHQIVRFNSASGNTVIAGCRERVIHLKSVSYRFTESFSVFRCIRSVLYVNVS